MKESQPSTNDWQRLYDAAVEFKKLKCWEWVLDSDIFGVQNPSNNEIGYCCITGYLGQHFALVVYLGTAGLEIYLKAKSGKVLESPLEIFANQKCLMASFEDRETLSKEDREVIKELGLRFRGQNQWPQFRSYQPGYPPWSLTRDEAEYLTLSLQQAKKYHFDSRKIRISWLHLKRAATWLEYLKKWMTDTGGQMSGWNLTRWKEEPEAAIPPINEIRLQRIKKTIKRRGGSWEIDFFFTPTPVEDGEGRPYYPYAVLHVDSYQGIVLNANMMKPVDYGTEIPNSLMSVIENAQVIPNEILVKKERTLELLNLIASRLGIRMKLMDRLEMLEQAQFSMLQLFR